MAQGFTFNRQRIIGLMGIFVSIALFLLVSAAVAIDKISTLRITYPGAKPNDPPLLDIPLPTVATTGIITLLLLAGALYLIVRQPQHLVPIYMGSLIFATIFIILIWAIQGSR